MEFEAASVLGDIAELVRGVAYKPDALLNATHDDAVPLLRATNIGNHALELSDVLYVPSKLVKPVQYLKKFDVVIAMSSGSRAAVGRLAQLRQDWSGTFGAFCGAIRPNAQKVDAEYLGYVLHSPDFRTRIDTYAAGTAIMNLSRDHLLQFTVRLPKRTVQRRIAEILGAIDERIQLLQQTSETLESIAGALFRSWFIDFDPVRAKANGREPDGISTAMAALFPHEFESRAAGPIPKGWDVRPFGEFAALAKGSVNPAASPGTTFEHYSLPAFDHDQLPAFEPSEAIKSNKTRVPQASVLQSKLNPHIPRVWYPGHVGQQAVCSTEFLPWTAKKGASPEFIYSVLRSTTFEAQVRTLVTGTSNSHQRVRPDQVAALTIVAGTEDVRAMFADIVRPMFDKVVENRLRARALLDLRSALLPRLISGRLRLPECQEQLREMIA